MKLARILKRAKGRCLRRVSALRTVWRDSSRFAKHSSTFNKVSTRSKLQGLIIRQAHGVEVGMIYRPTRAGFALESVRELMENLDRYIDDYGVDSLVTMTIETLQEYCNLNGSLGQELPDVIEETARLTKKTGSEVVCAGPPVPIKYQPKKLSDFDTLARCRRSCRDYDDREVEEAILLEAIDLALYSPSACNRQPCRVYRVVDPEKKRRVLELQNNRSSWRNDASILIVTAELGMYQGIRERTAAYVDGGLFCMTLAYSLNSRGLGTCMLNLNMRESDHGEMRRILDASESEVLIMMMAFGYTAGEILVPKKYHREPREVLQVR